MWVSDWSMSNLWNLCSRWCNFLLHKIEGYARLGDLTAAVEASCKMKYCSLWPRLLSFVWLPPWGAIIAVWHWTEQTDLWPNNQIRNFTRPICRECSRNVYAKFSLVDDAKDVFSLMHNRYMKCYENKTYHWTRHGVLCFYVQPFWSPCKLHAGKDFIERMLLNQLQLFGGTSCSCLEELAECLSSVWWGMPLK
jgi:hypothetical protein